MTSFSEDKIWKNISNTDVRILLNIVDVESEEVKIWTQELRIYDPRNYVPDLILELDNENLIMEMQSTPVDDNFSKRGLAYVAVGNKEKKNNKMMNLIVLSTAEESKTVRYNFTENSTFEYRVINLKDLDADEIITTVEEKIRKGLKIESEELIKYALVPMIKGDEMEKYITRVVDNILQVENISESLMILSYGIEWLIVDKFITDEECRNILCDKLGDRMSLIYEYGNRREQKGKDEGEKVGMEKGMKKGMKKIIESLIKSGSSLNEISQNTGMTLPELKKILEPEKKEKVTTIPAK